MMKLVFANKKFETNIESQNQNQYKVKNDLGEYNVVKLRENEFSVDIDNEGQKKVFAVSNNNKIYLQHNGDSYIFDIAPDVLSWDDEASAELDGTQAVATPMPGKVVRINVKVGDEVKEGDAIAVIEAMKMESTLYSAINGKVTEMNVEIGEQVDADFVLARISSK